MHAKFRSFLSFSPIDRRLFVKAWWTLLEADVRLRRTPFPSVQAWALAAGPTRSIGADPAVTIRDGWAMVDTAARNHLYPMTCLRKSLALQRLLVRQNIHTELRFGVRKESNQLQAHAWLEYQGQPIGQSEKLTQEYAVLLKQSSASSH